jgi:hypothetical protein
MGLISRDDGWRMPDWLWERIEPLLPDPPSHPLGCHNPRVPDRDAMDAILLVLQTGMQWNALKVTGICFEFLGAPALSAVAAGRRVFTSSGVRGCWSTTERSGSTGPGWRWTGR